MALRRARHGEGSARAEPLALVIEAVDLRGIGEAVVLLVDDQRVVVPGAPVPDHHLHELVGAVVAQVVLEVLVAAEVERLGVVERGHHVPGQRPRVIRSSVANTRATWNGS